MRETLEALEKILKKEIKTVIDKGTMTPTELDTIMKAMCAYDMAEERIMKESGYEGFSRDGGYSHRNYRDMGMSNMMPDQMMYGNSYNSYDGNSYARGRSPITGRYVSRDNYDSGRSGHSVNDRMIAALEQMVDQASNDYERQQILRQIEKMRNE